MGADIHAYPEFAYLGREERVWGSLCGQFSLSRDYDLFGKIAGIRGGQAMVPLRGLPTDMGFEAHDDCFELVEDYNLNPDFRVSREQAAQLVAEGRTSWSNESQVAIVNVDWHSFTWLASQELRKVLEAPRTIDYRIGGSWWALLAMLEEIERHECETRLVVWFDN